MANVKWLTRIEVTDQRYAGRFMARDYVTFREHTDDAGRTTWTFLTVGHDRLKSAPAKVVRNGSRHRVIGVAWGDRVADVEVSIDGGPWRKAELSGSGRQSSNGTAWRFWSIGWRSPRAASTPSPRGRSRVTARSSRAPTDPLIADKRTYWESNGHITRTVVI